MKYKVDYFKGLSQIEGLEKLLEISFLKGALLKCVLKEEGSSWFRVENHDGHCLTLSNEKYLVVLLIEVNEFIIKEIKEAIPHIDKYIPVVVKLEMDSYDYGFPREIDLKVEDICEMAKRDGVDHKNLFLIFLRILFNQKPY